MVITRTKSDIFYKDLKVRRQNLDDSFTDRSFDKESMGRPNSSTRFTNPLNFTHNLDGQDSQPWLTMRYIDEYGVNITKRALRDGLMKEIIDFEKANCPIDS